MRKDAIELLDLVVAGGESLGLEFESNRQKLSDRTIVEATATGQRATWSAIGRAFNANRSRPSCVARSGVVGQVPCSPEGGFVKLGVPDRPVAV